ncbi:MAG: lipoyl synthase [FCB group bacterium]|nr:lipoyl synthase [FCB group bacterium]
MSEKSKHLRRPPWLKVRAFGGDEYQKIRKRLRGLTLRTVCEDANCPNRGECFNSGTATFLLMGPICSRNCRFCNIGGGRPGEVDPREPENVAAMAAELQLSHVVITSVTRDDLPDQGAGQFRDTVKEVRLRLPQATIEILTPDFNGREDLIDLALESQPTVFNHNVETVPRLYSQVRPQADFQRSCRVLTYAADKYTNIRIKSGIMVGLGEETDELIDLFGSLFRAGIEILTIGQYLAPSRKHHPVVKYYTPEEFVDLQQAAESKGIPVVVSGPLVRSSYRAGTLMH